MAEHKNRARASWQPVNLATLALSVGGLGFLRPAPGTWGSLPPALLAAVLAAARVSPTVQAVVAGTFLMVASVICLLWGGYAEERFGRKDAAEVVADETAGVSVPVLLAVGHGGGVMAFAAAFLLFRLFDVVKPWPARPSETLPGGWGVLADDLVAGGYAALALFAVSQIWRGLLS